MVWICALYFVSLLREHLYVCCVVIQNSCSLVYFFKLTKTISSEHLPSLFSRFSCFNRMLWQHVKQQVIISVWLSVEDSFMFWERWKSGIIFRTLWCFLLGILNYSAPPGSCRSQYWGVCFPDSSSYKGNSRSPMGKYPSVLYIIKRQWSTKAFTRKV